MAQGEINPKEKLVIIGGSAGSLEVLLNILPQLDKALDFPLVIVLHRRGSNDTTLVDLLSVKTSLTVKEIEEKDLLRPGIIYLGPGDYHILFEKNHSLSLDYSEKVNYSRPSIDVAFQSAADVFGAGLTCILISGSNVDGTDGMIYAKEKKGTTVAQLPSSAEFGYMPEQAILKNTADHVLNVEQIAPFINSLMQKTAG